MRFWTLILVSLGLAGCASDGYRYHEDGYYAARAPLPHYDYGNACVSNYGPYGYGLYRRPGYSYPCGSGFGFSLGYGSWYGGGYWQDPYWSQRWYLPRTMEGPRAGARARALAGAAEAAGAFPSYENLAPTRRRDLGGGDRSWRELSPGPGSAYGQTPGMGSYRRGEVRSASGIGSGVGRAMSPAGSASSRFSAPPRSSSASAARTGRGESRQEE